VYAADHETAQQALARCLYDGTIPDGVEIDASEIGDAIGYRGVDEDGDDDLGWQD
jgi:hypothetical protein